jgi:type IV pilus assembly protein PilQ
MKPTDEQMTEWSDNRLQGLTKDQLIAAGEVLGCTFDRRNAEMSMRTSLCKKIGLESLDEPETVIEAMIPQIAKREVNTAVLVDDGQTVVIGGVYEFSDTSDVSKVPFLGDLPVIGNLFRNKSRAKSKAELLIFVTPKVMRVTQR